MDVRDQRLAGCIPQLRHSTQHGYVDAMLVLLNCKLLAGGPLFSWLYFVFK